MRERLIAVYQQSVELRVRTCAANRLRIRAASIPRRDLPHRIYASLGNNAALPERNNLLQIISPDGEVMSKIEYLHRQAARAERLAREVLDKLTVERLQAFADECRVQARTLASEERRFEAA